MNPKYTVWTLVIFLLVISLTGCGLFGGGEPTPEPVPVEAVQQPNVVSAEAYVVPLKQANLAFEVGGRVAAVYVEEGDPITKDQLLAELENSSQQASLIQAQASLAKQDKEFASFLVLAQKNGPARPELKRNRCYRCKFIVAR